MFGTDEDKKEPAEREVEDVDAVAEDFKTSDALDGKGVKVVEQKLEKLDDGEDYVWVVAIKCIPQQDRRGPFIWGFIIALKTLLRVAIGKGTRLM